MLYFFYGSEYEKVRGQARKIVDVLREKRPDASVVRLDSFNYSAASLDDVVGSQGLFHSVCIVELKDIAETKEGKAELMDRLEVFAESPNIFVWTERDMDAKSVATITKHAKEIKQFGVKVAKQSQAPATFDFARLCAERNRKEAWVMYETKIRREYAAEEVSGVLFWQYKMVLLAHQCRDAKEAGVSPYAFSNAQRLTKKVSEQEAEEVLFKIVSMYHDAHRGLADLDTAMERFVLGL